MKLKPMKNIRLALRFVEEFRNEWYRTKTFLKHEEFSLYRRLRILFCQSRSHAIHNLLTLPANFCEDREPMYTEDGVYRNYHPAIRSRETI